MELHAPMQATGAQGAQVAVLGRPYRQNQQAPVRLFRMQRATLPVCAAMARLIHGFRKTMQGGSALSCAWAKGRVRSRAGQGGDWQGKMVAAGQNSPSAEVFENAKDAKRTSGVAPAV
jgi:hypothetical protein